MLTLSNIVVKVTGDFSINVQALIMM